MLKSFYHFKQISFSIIVCTSLLFASCLSIGSPDSSEYVTENTLFENQLDYLDALKALENENRRQFILGAISLCNGEEYEKTLGGVDFSQKLNAINDAEKPWCYSYFGGYQLQNPYEYYTLTLEDNQEISRNSQNPFKLKEIRESSKYASDIVRISKEAEKINPLSLKYYSMSGGLREFDFSTKEQKISFNPNFGVSGMSMNPNNRLPSTFTIKVDEQQSKEIFEYYQNGKSTKENGYTKSYYRQLNTINAIVTYELKAPTRKYSRNFENIPVKVEFFDHEGWSNKLGEFYYIDKDNN